MATTLYSSGRSWICWNMLSAMRSLMTTLPLASAALVNLVLADDLVAELGAGQFVAPILERPLGELHDVALVHQRHAGQLLVEGVADRHADEPFAAFGAHRLDADAATRAARRSPIP